MAHPTATREERRRARIEEQRRARRHQRRTRVLPMPAIAGLVVVVVVIGAAGFAVRLRADRDQMHLVRLTRAGSIEMPGAPTVAVERTPAAYRIVYRAENRGEHIGVHTEILTVRRPWDSRTEARRGKPPGTEAVATEVLTFGRRRTTSAGQAAVVLELPPALPSADTRLVPSLDAGLAGGVLERREVRQVAGRPCQVYRSFDALGAQVLHRPTPDRHVDSCVDAAGLVLEEVIVDGDGPVTRRVAVAVDEHPALTEAVFPSGPGTVEPAAGGGLVRLLKEGSMPPGDFHVLDAPPDGFVHRGRYSVVPPQPENFDDNSPEAADRRRAEIADVFERGLDVLVVTQGGTLRGVAPFELLPDSPRVDLGRFGTGEVWVSATGNQVRTVLDGGHYLVVSGTLPPDDLAAAARSLRTIPGGGTLEYADGP